MKHSLLFLLLATGFCSSAQFNYRAEHALLITTVAEKGKDDLPVYKLKSAVDIPLTAVTAGWTYYAFSKIYKKEASSPKQIQDLTINDLNGFDRWAAGRHSEKAADASDLFFYGAMPMPLLLLLDKHMRHDAGKIGLLYLEAMSVTGLLYSSSTYFVDRYRPLAYSTELSVDQRKSGNNRNSFFAGHVALVGTSTFFAAKVFSDYHPDSKLRYAFWGAAAVATGATGYLRHRAGKHFPSDIVIGTTVGALSGILVPQLHKTKLIKNQNITLIPFSGSTHGLAMICKL